MLRSRPRANPSANKRAATSRPRPTANAYVITRIAARQSGLKRAPAGARAGVYVLDGKLIAGPVEWVTELSAGDYASFPIDLPHVFETERAGARGLVLTYGP